MGKNVVAQRQKLALNPGKSVLKNDQRPASGNLTDDCQIGLIP